MDDGWLIIYSGILRPYMHIYIYIYIVPYVLDIFIVHSVSHVKDVIFDFCWFSWICGLRPVTTLGLQWDFGWWWYIWYTMFIPSKAFYPSGKHTDSYWTWWFVWIYPLKMVIFHSFLHVYQRVTPWKGPHVHPESCCVRKLGFGTAADHHVHHRWLGRRNAATATLISQKLWPRGMKIHGMY